MIDRLVKIKEINEKLAIPKSTLWLWIKNSQFPRPIKTGPRSVAFRESDLNAWLDAKHRESIKEL